MGESNSQMIDREEPFDKVPFDKKPKRRSCVGISAWKSVPGRENRRYKISEAGKCFVLFE